MKIHFLGTNGWYDTPETGSTMCTLIDAKEGYIILDAGFGIYRLGKYITEDKPIYLFISHFHLDHVCGFHVMPKFKFKQKMTIVFQDELTSIKTFSALTSHPLCADVKFYNFPIEALKIKSGGHTKPVKFECLPLQHIVPCLGYRFYLEDKVIAYCSDTAPCENSVRLAQNADLLIHECTLSPGVTDGAWGHSNPIDVAGVAKQSEAKRLVLSHFDAENYDTKKKRKIGIKAAKKLFSKIIGAKDGMKIKI